MQDAVASAGPVERRLYLPVPTPESTERMIESKVQRFRAEIAHAEAAAAQAAGDVRVSGTTLDMEARRAVYTDIALGHGGQAFVAYGPKGRETGPIAEPRWGWDTGESARDELDVPADRHLPLTNGQLMEFAVIRGAGEDGGLAAAVSAYASESAGNVERIVMEKSRLMLAAVDVYRAHIDPDNEFAAEPDGRKLTLIVKPDIPQGRDGPLVVHSTEVAEPQVVGKALLVARQFEHDQPAGDREPTGENQKFSIQHTLKALVNGSGKRAEYTPFPGSQGGATGQYEELAGQLSAESDVILLHREDGPVRWMTAYPATDGKFQLFAMGRPDLLKTLQELSAEGYSGVARTVDAVGE